METELGGLIARLDELRPDAVQTISFLREVSLGVDVSGNDPEAKAQVTRWLREWFGWRDVVDLGDLTTARGTEMVLPSGSGSMAPSALRCST